jgi:hypothetical protein
MNSSFEFGISLLFPWKPEAPWSLAYQDPAGGYDLDFSTFAAATLHEGAAAEGGGCMDDGSGGLDELAGVATPPGYPYVAIKFTGSDLGTYFAPGDGHPIDWDISMTADSQHIFGDVSGDGTCSALPGYDDMAPASAGPGVTKLANLHPNAVCAAGTWTNGTPQP